MRRPTMNICTGCSCIARPPERRRFVAAAVRFDRAISRDPNFFGPRMRTEPERSLACAPGYPRPACARCVREQARSSAERAVALAPPLGEAHLALGVKCPSGFSISRRRHRNTRERLELTPGSAEVAKRRRRVLRPLQRAPRLRSLQRAAQVSLDPAGFRAHLTLAEAYYHARRFNEGLAAIEQARQIDPARPRPRPTLPSAISPLHGSMTHGDLRSRGPRGSTRTMSTGAWQSRITRSASARRPKTELARLRALDG